MLIKIDDNYICSVSTVWCFNYLDIKYLVNKYTPHKNFLTLLAFMSKRNDNYLILLTKHFTQLKNFYQDLRFLYNRIYSLEDYRYFIKFSKHIIGYLWELSITVS